MTVNQVAYAQVLENSRHNREQERISEIQAAEAKRSNVVNERLKAQQNQITASYNTGQLNLRSQELANNIDQWTSNLQQKKDEWKDSFELQDYKTKQEVARAWTETNENIEIRKREAKVKEDTYALSEIKTLDELIIAEKRLQKDLDQLALDREKFWHTKDMDQQKLLNEWNELDLERYRIILQAGTTMFNGGMNLLGNIVKGKSVDLDQAAAQDAIDKLTERVKPDSWSYADALAAQVKNAANINNNNSKGGRNHE